MAAAAESECSDRLEQSIIYEGRISIEELEYRLGIADDLEKCTASYLCSLSDEDFKALTDMFLFKLQRMSSTMYWTYTRWYVYGFNVGDDEGPPERSRREHPTHHTDYNLGKLHLKEGGFFKYHATRTCSVNAIEQENWKYVDNMEKRSKWSTAFSLDYGKLKNTLAIITHLLRQLNGELPLEKLPDEDDEGVEDNIEDDEENPASTTEVQDQQEKVDIIENPKRTLENCEELLDLTKNFYEDSLQAILAHLPGRTFLNSL
jgi:hypothetical protein